MILFLLLKFSQQLSLTFQSNDDIEHAKQLLSMDRNIEALDEQALSTLYDIFDIHLSNIIIILTRKDFDWRNVQVQQQKRLAILPCTNMEIQLQLCVVADKSILPVTRIFGRLSSVDLQISSSALLRFIDLGNSFANNGSPQTQKNDQNLEKMSTKAASHHIQEIKTNRSSIISEEDARLLAKRASVQVQFVAPEVSLTLFDAKTDNKSTQDNTECEEFFELVLEMRLEGISMSFTQKTWQQEASVKLSGLSIIDYFSLCQYLSRPRQITSFIEQQELRASLIQDNFARQFGYFASSGLVFRDNKVLLNKENTILDSSDSTIGQSDHAANTLVYISFGNVSPTAPDSVIEYFVSSCEACALGNASTNSLEECRGMFLSVHFDVLLTIVNPASIEKIALYVVHSVLIPINEYSTNSSTESITPESDDQEGNRASSSESHLLGRRISNNEEPEEEIEQVATSQIPLQSDIETLAKKEVQGSRIRCRVHLNELGVLLNTAQGHKPLSHFSLREFHANFVQDPTDLLLNGYLTSISIIDLASCNGQGGHIISVYKGDQVLDGETKLLAFVFKQNTLPPDHPRAPKVPIEVSLDLQMLNINFVNRFVNECITYGTKGYIGRAQKIFAHLATKRVKTAMEPTESVQAIQVVDLNDRSAATLPKISVTLTDINLRVPRSSNSQEKLVLAIQSASVELNLTCDDNLSLSAIAEKRDEQDEYTLDLVVSGIRMYTQMFTLHNSDSETSTIHYELVSHSLLGHTDFGVHCRIFGSDISHTVVCIELSPLQMCCSQAQIMFLQQVLISNFAEATAISPEVWPPMETLIQMSDSDGDGGNENSTDIAPINAAIPTNLENKTMDKSLNLEVRIKV